MEKEIEKSTEMNTENNIEKKEKKRGVRVWKCILSIVFVLVSVMLIYLLYWAKYTFGNIPFAQVLFHLMVPLEGTDSSIITSYFYGVLPWACLAAGIVIVVGVSYYLTLDCFEENGVKNIAAKVGKAIVVVNRFLVNKMVLLTSLFLVIVLIVNIFGFGIHSWIIDRIDSSTLFEDYYVDASKANIKAPEKKKNLIYILAESLESSFTDFENGGCMDRNYMPKLTELAKENTHFSRNETLAGAVEVEGTGWTIAAMVAQTSGVPLMLPIGRNSYGKYGEFLPGITSLGEILEENGYVNEIVFGSKREFAGVDTYFEQHGNYELFDYYTALEEGYVDGHNGFWGVDDVDLIKIAKDEINELAAGDQPFSIIVNTIDLHTPSGYECSECYSEYGDKYKNIIACQDRLLTEFVEWCQQQDFYENTTVIIVGDHESMDNGYFQRNVDPAYQRMFYNCIVNAPIAASDTKNRDYCAVDLFPTTLAALGCTIEGDRLGLGTNLFSSLPTLAEKWGFERFDTELGRASDYYAENFHNDPDA
mgnify:CR=1 FL=1